MPASIHCGSISNETMLVTTRCGSMRTPRTRARPSARAFALRWSSTSRSRISSSATSAAAAITPACRIAPPSSLRTRRAFATVSAVPQRIDPTGAERPFEKQNWIVSAGAQSSRASTPSAAAALKILAPSRCTRMPFRCARPATACVCAAVITEPPQLLCEFSRQTSDVRGNIPCGRMAASMSSRAGRPSRFGTRRGCSDPRTNEAPISF